MRPIKWIRNNKIKQFQKVRDKVIDTENKQKQKSNIDVIEIPEVKK